LRLSVFVFPLRAMTPSRLKQGHSLIEESPILVPPAISPITEVRSLDYSGYMTDMHEKRLRLPVGSFVGSRFRFSRIDVVVISFILFLFVIQRVAFEILGTDPTGSLVLDAIKLLANSLAFGCCVAASFRGRGATRIFWLLFAAVSILELIGDAGK